VNSHAPPRGPRILASLAVLSFAATFLAAQIDFFRRHRIGISLERYLWPQLLQIWLPGLGATAALAVLAFILHRRGRRA